MGKYYAVRVGHKTGVFTAAWSVVEKYVSGYPGAVYKSFKTAAEAEAFMDGVERVGSVEAAMLGSSDTTTGGMSEDARIRELALMFDMALYTDGGFQKNHGSAALVVTQGHELVAEYVKWIGSVDVPRFVGQVVTNNTAELHALKMAMQYVATVDPAITNIVVFSDSDYAQSVVSGVKKAHKNLELVRAIQRLYKAQKHRITFAHSPAHSGVKWNERCDELCTEEILSHASRG